MGLLLSGPPLFCRRITGISALLVNGAVPDLQVDPNGVASAKWPGYFDPGALGTKYSKNDDLNKT